jgi:photosystem II stability/assembly factor-like uncharacterized protein
VSDPERALAQSLKELVASGAAEPGGFSPADARRAARLRLVPFSDRRRRYRRPRSPAVRVASVVAVAALIVAVFVAPWPNLHLFGTGSSPRAADPYAAMPVVAESGSSTCRPVSSARDGGADLALSDVQFVSPERGWVVGAGRILATVDGGRSWQVQYRGPADLIDVDFVDANHGFAVGADQLLTTDDGGQQWSQLREPCLSIRAVDFASPTMGYAVGGGTPYEGQTFQGSRLLVTTDGGRQWRRDTKAPTGPQSLSFATEQDGWVGTPGRVWHTTDGGLHWTLSFTEPASHPVVSSYPGDTSLVQCGTAQAAWVLFVGSGAATMHSPYVAFATTDGHDWHAVLEETFTEGGMTEVHAPDGPGTYPGPFSAVSGETAVFVGFSPPLSVAPMDIATDNGRKLSSPRAVTGIWDPTGTAFLSGDTGWVIGLAAGNEKDWVIDATADGGRTWALQWSSAASRSIEPVTQTAVAADASSYPALSETMLQALQAQNDGATPVLVPRSSDPEAISAKRAVEAATTYQAWKGARVVAAGLARIRTGVGVATGTAWLVVIDPPGRHTCITYGPSPVPPNCRLNLYVVAVNALSGGVLWSGDSSSAPFGPLPVFTTAG